MTTRRAETRAIELEIRVRAPVEHAWSALSDPDQLANWFPLEARGTTGKGGKISLSWGSTGDWTTTIDVWQPNEHIRFVDPPAVEGAPPVAVDFRIESDGGATVIRLVNSGFSVDAQWDEMFGHMASGWKYFMYNLQHYLERHYNVRRDMVWSRRATAKAPSAVWGEVLGGGGLGLSDHPSDLEPGTRYSTNVFPERFEGVVTMNLPHIHFAGTVPTLNDGLLFVEIEPGKESRHVGIWLSTYGLDGARVAALQDAVTEVGKAVCG